MLSLDQLRKIDPDLANLSDEQLTAIRADLYQTTQLAFEVWWLEKSGSKFPVRSSPSSENDITI